MKTAKIVCAGNVSDAAYRDLCARLCAQFGEIGFEKETDASLVGGFIVLYDGKVYDMSLRTQLETLRNACAQ